ncbi:MAG: alpha/beta hydrolase [Thermoleophilia bacterium]|nr:alpha/beta hydrolase [Thermoleophilia bacterium]
MATFVLIHGGGSRGSTFDLLANELRSLGHEVLAPDLPIDEPTGDLSACARAVVELIGDRDGVVVVGHSFGGFVAPLVAAWSDPALLVLMSAQLPAPGETAAEWREASGWEAATRGMDMSDNRATYLHDVPTDLADAELASGRDHCAASMQEPWPLDAWPDVPTRVLAFADDRRIPLEFQRRLARERAGVEADAMPGSHGAYLARPAEVAARLHGYL